MRHSNDRGENVTMQTVGDDESRGAEQLESGDGLGPSTLVLALFLVALLTLLVRIDAGGISKLPVNLLVGDIAAGA